MAEAPKESETRTLNAPPTADAPQPPSGETESVDPEKIAKPASEQGGRHAAAEASSAPENQEIDGDTKKSAPLTTASPKAAETPESEDDQTTVPQPPSVSISSILQGSGQPVLLNGRFNILPSTPLEELDSPSARAFAVEDRVHPKSRLFALICLPGIPVRMREVNEVIEQEMQGVLQLIDAGVVDWPLLGQSCFVLIYNRPLGGRLSTVFQGSLKEYEKTNLVRVVIDSVVEGLQQLKFRSITHRAVRPDNIYFMDEAREIPVVGDFLSSPPGFDQPVAFETIARSMAMEHGRGVGTSADDLYALGISLAFLMQKKNPIKGKTKEQIILSKITETSYQTVVGRNLVTSTLLELLRGLLNDEEDQRWSFREVETWSIGRKVKATQPRQVIKSQRAFTFGEIEHFQTRSLAYSMSIHPESALKLIKDGKLEQWISRGLEDFDLAKSIAGAIETAKAKSNNLADADGSLLTQVLLILDPNCPIVYKNCAFMPDGFNSLLAIEVMRGGKVKTISELVVGDIPQIWFSAQPEGIASMFASNTSYATYKNHLQKAGPGFGVERCVYEGNPGMPCDSPILKSKFIDEIAELLPALNDAEKNFDSKTSPMDRHIAAFIAARYDGELDGFLNEMADLDEAIAAAAMLKLFAHLQDRYGPKELHGLTKWIGSQMGPVIKLHRSRTTRRNIEGEIPSIVRSGSLPDLLALLDNAEVRMTDNLEYGEALVNFREAEVEIEQNEERSRPDSQTVMRLAKQGAATLSILIMIFILSLMIIIF